MPLATEQLELIHAHLDGETTPTEEAAVLELLASSAEAQSYRGEIQRVRALLAEHAFVKAPAGLHARVVDALPKAPVYQLPRSGWRNALMAAAAVLIVSVALVFAMQPREVIEEQSLHVAAAPAGPSESMAGKQPEEVEEIARDGRPQPPKVVPPPAADVLDTPRATVFNLDRGADEPFAVSVNFARDGGGEVLRAYNDLLVVGSNFGDARLVGTNLGAWDEDEFVGLDFSIVDGLAISVDSEHVPALLAALNRMAGDQGFGQLIVPADLIGSVASADSALQRSGRSARDYLPQDERRDPLRAERAVTRGTDDGARKVNLIIRLR